MTGERAFLIGPSGQISRLTGPTGLTPKEPTAVFKKGDVVGVRRLKHLRHLPDRAAIAAVIPIGYSADWAWADLCGKPRPLMATVGRRYVRYIVGFDGDPTPHVLREKDIIATEEPPVPIRLVGDDASDAPRIA